MSGGQKQPMKNPENTRPSVAERLKELEKLALFNHSKLVDLLPANKAQAHALTFTQTGMMWAAQALHAELAMTQTQSADLAKDGLTLQEDHNQNP